MRFTLDGEPFELTPTLVRARIDGHQPEVIREYWVEIDGVRWPVKQVIGLATGAARGRFQSQASRRWLGKLGFTTGTDLASSGSPPRPVRTSREFDPTALRVLDEVDLRITFSWLRAGPVTLDSTGLPAFPPLPRVPGLYRLDFGTGTDQVRRLYIGESVELQRRASNYRNAKTDRTRQRTSRRIHKQVVAHLVRGGAIDFAIATVVQGVAGALDLRLKSARRVAENAAVLLAQGESATEVLNIDADLALGDVMHRGDDE